MTDDEANTALAKRGREEEAAELRRLFWMLEAAGIAAGDGITATLGQRARAHLIEATAEVVDAGRIGRIDTKLTARVTIQLSAVEVDR